MAGRLAESPSVSVLLLEVGGDDDTPSVRMAGQWPMNLGTDRDWQFQTVPDESVNGRAVPMSMGEVLGGGSSINAMIWARGHRADWEFFASESGDSAWSYASILDVYRRIEDWHGVPDPSRRGTGGPVFVQTAPDPGEMMENPGGASIVDLRARDGYRQSSYRTYVHPNLERPNLTVISGALVTRLTMNGTTVTGVEFVHRGSTHLVEAGSEVVLSLGAVNTPKLSMQSGIGDHDHLRQHGIPLVQHLPGVGQNFQDHIGFDCVWECDEPLTPHNNGVEATYFWSSDVGTDSPDIQTCQAEMPKSSSSENTARFAPPNAGWNLFPGPVQAKSSGELRLTGPSPHGLPAENDTLAGRGTT